VVTLASSNLNVDLKDPSIRQMALCTPPGGVQGFGHQGGPGRKRMLQGGSPHDYLAPSVYTCCLPIKLCSGPGSN
jgi:hypothetical protein